jgi:hypothetical protein
VVPVPSAPDAKRVAVVVGIGDYPQAAGFAPLNYAENDAREMATVLTNAGYRVALLTNARATRTAILSAIASVSRDSSDIVFYFSGHGYAMEGRNYLAGYDASAAMLADAGLGVQDVQKVLSNAKRVSIFIDACRIAPTSKGLEPERLSEYTDVAEGQHILFASKPGGVSYEVDDLRHGLFTYFLLEGLQGKAADSDATVRFEGLTRYVTQNVVQSSRARGFSQIPYEAGEASGDFVITRIRAATISRVGTFPSASASAGQSDSVLSKREKPARTVAMTESQEDARVIYSEWLRTSDARVGELLCRRYPHSPYSEMFRMGLPRGANGAEPSPSAVPRGITQQSEAEDTIRVKSSALVTCVVSFFGAFLGMLVTLFVFIAKLYADRHEKKLVTLS